MLTVITIILLCAAAWQCECAEKRSRKYFTDQWLLRGSGACLGAALVLLFVLLA